MRGFCEKEAGRGRKAKQKVLGLMGRLPLQNKNGTKKLKQQSGNATKKRVNAGSCGSVLVWFLS